MSRPWKVVHVASRLNAGGLAVQVLNAVNGLDGEEFECSAVAGQVANGEADILEFMRPPRRLHVIPELGRKVYPLADFIAFVKLCDHFRDVRPDIVHTHASKAGALGRLAARIAKVPVVVHSYHGHVFRHYFGPRVSKAIVSLERLMGRITDAVCLPCQSLAVEIAEEFRVVPSGKTRVVRYGIDVDYFAEKKWNKGVVRHLLGIPKDAQVIGTVGRIAPIKNHAMMLEAFANLASRNNRVVWLLHGDGECREGIVRDIQRMGLESRVYMRQWCPDLRMPYAAMDVLAIPSKAEGMPIAALEAMAAGVPVAATAVGGIPKLLGKRGYISSDMSPGMFALLLELSLKDPMDIGRAREYVRANHSLDALVGDTARVYRELLEAKGCRR